MVDTDKSLPESIPVDIGGGEIIEVKKLPLGKYKMLTDWLKGFLPKFREKYGAIFSPDEVVDLTPELVIGIITDHFEDIIELLEIGTGLDREKIVNELGVYEAYELILAIVKASRLDKMLKNVLNPTLLREAIGKMEKKIPKTG